MIVFGLASASPNCFCDILKDGDETLAADDQKVRAQQLLRRALKDLELAARLLDLQDAAVIQRLRSASREVKIAESQLR